MSKQCPKCKRSLGLEASYCTYCGARIIQEREPSRSATRGKGQTAVIPGGLILVGVAMVVAAVLWWQSNPPRRETTYAPTAPPASRVPATAERGLPYPDVPRISAVEAGKRLGEFNVIFLDTRSATAYTQSHIAGAILIEPAELGDRFQELAPEAEIITYCT